MPYQSFDGQQGDSQSEEKLQRIKLPASLAGKSVLDLGCNAGYFCLEARRRGAVRVVGIDHDPRAIAVARERAAEAGLAVDFICAKVSDLPKEAFDYVLLLSIIHYIDEPAALLADIRNVLKGDGTLILELGISSAVPGIGLARAMRSIDERYFATEELLRKVWLNRYSVRNIGSSVAQSGDPIPRRVFHCTPIKTNVLFIIGNGGIGKSTLSWQIEGAPIVSTDELFNPARTHNYKKAAAQLLYDTTFERTGSIWVTWDIIKQQDGVKAYFGDVIAGAIRQCFGSGLIVVEGFVLESVIENVKKVLGERYSCWMCSSA